MIYIISRGSNHPSAFPVSIYRPYSEIQAKIEFFVKKKVTNIEILPGFWLTKVGNGYFNINTKFPDHTVRISYKIVIDNIFRVVINSLLNSIFAVKYSPK